MRQSPPTTSLANIVIRDAVAGDIPAILALYDAGRVEGAAATPSDPAHPGCRAAFDLIAADPNQRLVVALLDHQIVATVQISFIPGLARDGMLRGLLESVHVRADLRGHGIGSHLVNRAVAICRERRCGLVQLTSNKNRRDAHRFYRALGFEQSHEGFKLFIDPAAPAGNPQ